MLRVLGVLGAVLVLAAGAGLALAVGGDDFDDRARAACDEYRAAVREARGDRTQLQREVDGYVAAADRLTRSLERAATEPDDRRAVKPLIAELRAGQPPLRRIQRRLEAGQNLAALRAIERYNRRTREDNKRIRAAERDAGLEGCTGL
jgi:hypothetical protein